MVIGACMDASAATFELYKNELRPVWRLLARCGLVLFGVVAAILGCRRLAGALTEPLPPSSLVAFGCLLAAIAIAIERNRHLLAASARSRKSALAAGPIFIAILAALALSLPGSSAWGLAGLWSAVALVPLVRWGPRLATMRPRRRFLPPRAQPGASTDRAAVAVASSECVLDPAITQQMVRRTEAAGVELIEGHVRACFEQGQRTVAAHIAFCPPLAAVPQCFAEQVDGPSVDIKVAQLLPYGVRFELKLEQAAGGGETVLFEFVAREAHVHTDSEL